MAGDNAEVRIIADLQRYVDEVKKLGPVTDQEAIKAAFALESRITKASEKAAKAAEAAAKKAGDSSSKSAKKTGDAFAEVGEKAEKSFSKLGKAAALTGDAFGGLAGPIGDIGDAFGMMDPRVAAVVVTVGALIGTFSALVSTSLDVIRNADDYGIALGENQDAIYSAKGALEDLDYTFKEQKATIAGILAPAIEGLAHTYIGLSDQVAKTFDEISEGPNLENLERAAKIAAFLGLAFASPAQAATMLATDLAYLGEEVGDLAEKGADIADKNRQEARAAEMSLRQFQAAFQAFEREQADAEKARDDARRKREDEAKRRAEQARAEAKRADDEAFKAFEKEFEASQERMRSESSMAMMGSLFFLGMDDAFSEVEAEMDRLNDIADKNRQYEFEATVKAEKERLAELARLQDEAAHEAYVRDREQRLAYEKSQVDGVASISGYVGQTLDVISGMFDENTKEGRKAIRELAVAQKAAAIFDVAIKGVQAVMAALTVPPPAGTALAVVAGAAAVASAAAVAAQPLPSFHTGRFAGAIQPVQPDEGPALLRRGEVVVPATTVAANGGIDQVRRRLGESGDGGGRVNVFLDLTDRTVRVPLARDIARSMNRTAYLGWAT